jgi:hypothetical protein
MFYREPLCATEVPQPDPDLNDGNLDRAATEVVGKIHHDPQGIAPTGHNWDQGWVGPVDHSEIHNGEQVANGYGPVE